MNEPIENSYFNWLCAKVLERNTRDYELLMEILFKTEFVWVVSADEHRVEDAVELRRNYLTRRSILYRNLEGSPISIFEVLLAFAQRASFQTDISIKKWFWEFLGNLRLDQFKEVSDSDIPLIEDILYTFTWRIYEPTGHGGLFPMEHACNDQREIEIWYQFCEYVISKGLV